MFIVFKIFFFLMTLAISAIHREFCMVTSGDGLRGSDSAFYLIAGNVERKGIALIVHMISKDFLTLILYPTSVNNRQH